MHRGCTQAATAQAAESLWQFRARSESHIWHPGRRSERLEAVSDGDCTHVVLSSDFDAAATRSKQCSAEALNKLQRERSCRYSSYVHCQSPV